MQFCPRFRGREKPPLVRRIGTDKKGGFRKRKNIIRDPIEANALIDDLREKNKKFLGEQPLDAGLTVGKMPFVDVVDVSAGAPSPTIVDVHATEPRDADAGLLSWELERDVVESIKSKMNPHFAVIPEDFPHFDFTEMEADLQKNAVT